MDILMYMIWVVRVEGVHEQWVTLGQAGNRRPRPVFISYLMSTFYIHMLLLPASTINLVSFFAYYLQVAALAFVVDWTPSLTLPACVDHFC